MKNETVSHVETKLNHSMYFSSHTLLISQIKVYKLSVLLKAKIWTSTTCSGIVFCTPICNKNMRARVQAVRCLILTQQLGFNPRKSM